MAHCWEKKAEPGWLHHTGVNAGPGVRAVLGGAQGRGRGKSGLCKGHKHLAATLTAACCLHHQGVSPGLRPGRSVGPPDGWDQPPALDGLAPAARSPSKRPEPPCSGVGLLWMKQRGGIQLPGESWQRGSHCPAPLTARGARPPPSGAWGCGGGVDSGARTPGPSAPHARSTAGTAFGAPRPRRFAARGAQSSTKPSLQHLGEGQAGRQGEK